MRVGNITTVEDFWKHTEQEGECIVWTGARNRRGYGTVTWKKGRVLAHRLAFYLREGRWPAPIGMHTCDNPPCVLHIVEATQAENIADMMSKGRHRRQGYGRHGYNGAL